MFDDELTNNNVSIPKNVPVLFAVINRNTSLLAKEVQEVKYLEPRRKLSKKSKRGTSFQVWSKLFGDVGHRTMSKQSK